MELRRWAKLAAAAQIAVLAGCVPTTMAPTVTATPGPGKLPANFAADQNACSAQASQQMATTVQAANNQVAGTALQNVLTGTGDNAVTVNAQATAALQQQYDTAYSMCMYAKGDNVPPYYMQPQPTEYSEETPAPRTRKRVVQKAPSKTETSHAANTSLVAPAPTAASGFVEPAPAAAPGSTDFFEPPPVHR
jgi:hypothetical protein